MNIALTSIQINYNGNITAGSLHCCQRPSSPVSDIYIHAGGASMRGVFVLPNMSPFGCRMQITVGITNIAAPIALSLQVDHAAGSAEGFYGKNLSSVIQTISQDGRYTFTVDYLPTAVSAYDCVRYEDTYTLSYVLTGEQPTAFASIQCISYGLTNRPLAPFDTAAAPYNAGNTNYVPTALLDFVADALLSYPSADTVGAITQFLNRSSPFVYDTVAGASHYFSVYAGVEGVRLDKWLRHLQTAIIGYSLNCSDCAAIIQTAARAIGLACYSADMAGALFGTGFRTNPIIAIGASIWAVPFNGNGFSYHCVNVLTPPASGYVAPPFSEPIYDACLSLDSGDDPTSDISIKVPLIPCHYSFAQIEQPITETATAPYTHPFYRPRLSAQGQSCIWHYQYPIQFLDSNLNQPMSVTNSTKNSSNPRIGWLAESLGLLESPFAESHFETSPAPMTHPSALDRFFSPHTEIRIDDAGPRYQDWAFLASSGTHTVHLITCRDLADLHATLIATLATMTHPKIRPYEKLANTVAYWGDSQWILVVRGCQIITVTGAEIEKLSQYITRK